MRNIFRLFVFAILALNMVSCNKAENKDYFEAGAAPALSGSKTGTIPLSYATQDQEAIKLAWTNPEYMFTTGISSQNVNYVIEIDTTGANFANPNRKSISLNGDLTLAITQAQLNDYLLNQLQLQVGAAHNIEMRVTSSIRNTVPLHSNVLKFTAVTPYAIPPKVQPPASGHLYLVGDATPGGWNNPVPLPGQEFAKVSSTMYQITVSLTGSKHFLFLPVNGDWSNKYACHDGSTQAHDGGDFGYNGGDPNFNADIPGPDGSGTFKITVDFQRGKYTITQ
jgi:hypothetical protein